MATRKEIVWRQFGTSFEGENIHIEEAIQRIGADFNVSKQPLVRLSWDDVNAIKEGRMPENFKIEPHQIVTSHAMTIREDADFNLGVVGRDYGVVQNSKAFEFVNFIEEVSGHKPIVETAGLLGHGERIFVACRLGEDAFLDKDDAVHQYCIFTNGHDGSMSVMCFFSSVRVICSNSLSAAIASTPDRISFRHSVNVNERMNWEDEFNRKRALEVFSKSVKFSDAFIARLLNLKEDKVDEIMLSDFAARSVLSPQNIDLYFKNNRQLDSIEEVSTKAKNQFNALIETIHNGVGQTKDECNYQGTKLWLYNGLTSYIQNEKTWTSAEKQFDSVLTGSENKRVQKAFDYLIAA